MSQKYLWLNVVLFLLLPYYFCFCRTIFAFPVLFFVFQVRFFVFQNAIQKQKTYFRVNSKHTKKAQVLILTFPNIPFDKQSESKPFLLYKTTVDFQTCIVLVLTQGLTDFNSNKNKLRLLDNNTTKLISVKPPYYRISYIIYRTIDKNR